MGRRHLDRESELGLAGMGEDLASSNARALVGATHRVLSRQQDLDSVFTVYFDPP